MSNAGASIEAVLTLNSSGFNSGIKSAISSVKGLSESATGVRALNDALAQMESTLQTLSGVSKSNLNTFSRLSTAINKMANGLKILQNDSIDVVEATNTMNSIFRAFQGALNGTEIKVKGVIGDFTQLSTAINNSANASKMSIESQREVANSLNRNRDAVMKLISGNQELANSQNQLQSEERETASATEQATNSMNRQASASSRLGKAMSSLRMMGTMVGSMMVYNLAHNLITATRETVNAKSEMNGYFQMLGYTSGEVEHFNGKLDEMIQKFPRINKYALGETISSIGVEFELTTQEMEKAMPVVSMITSEYLRAGRNVNEASLAVKDILQGEFQRLSRETGVKGEQLKEAGWSGDKNDVMGLLEALDKVGKSRNWDIFVAKANSLNDAVIILQNRFGEWSADMVERIQPTILAVFNDLMVVATSFGKVMNGALDWLSGNGIAQSIVKWGGLALAIGNVVSGLIVYRTGANLTQIAQMGLTKSIGATILGLEAETVAEQGLRNTIVQNITSIKAQTLAEELNISTRRARWVAIMSTVTGLEAETVAQLGLTKSLFASIFALDKTTLKEKGFLVALGSAVTGIEAETFALKSHNAQLLLTAGSIGAVAGALALLTGYFVIQAIKINDAIDKYNRFRNILEHGDDTIKEYKDTLDSLTQKKQELSDKLNTLTKDSYEYKKIADELVTVNKDLETATTNYNDSVNAVAWSKHKQELYDDEKQKAQLHSQREINEALIDYGVNIKEANEIASPIWTDAIDGWNQQYETLQRVNLQYSKNATTVKSYLNQLNEQKIDPKEVQVIIKPLIKSGNKIAEAKEKLGQSTGFMEYVDAWLWLQYWQIQHAVDEFWVNTKIDFGKAVNGLFKGLGEGLGSLHLPMNELIKWIVESLGFDFENMGLQLEFPSIPFAIGEWLGSWIRDSVDWNGLNEAITDVCNQISDYDLFGEIQKQFSNIDLLKIITDILLPSDSNSLQEQLGKWLSDSVNSIDIMGMLNDILLPFGDIDLWSVLSNIGFLSPVSASDGSSDHPSFMEDVSAILGFDIQQWIINFQTDPLGTLGIDLGGFNIGSLISSILGTGSAESGDDPLGGYLNTVMTNLGNGIVNGIRNIPIIGSIAEMLGLVPSEDDNAYQTGYNLIDNLKSGVEQKIREIPIVGDIAQMLGLIPSQNSNANAKGEGIGTNIKDGEKAGHQGLSDNVKTEMGNVITAISNKFGEAYSTAHNIGSQILNGIKDALDMHSPSIISRELIANEFGVYIPQAITDASTTAYDSAYTYGQQIRDGISATNFNTIGFDSAVGEYEDDAQMVADSSYLMGTTTTTAFNDMTTSVNASTSQMQTNVVGTYSQIQTKQASSLDSMKTQNIQAYQDMHLKSNQSLIQMRDSTSNVTHQMTQAWTHMKDQIVTTANKLKTDSTSHFNQLSTTIGGFYRKIQNPSSWGSAGSPSLRSSAKPNRRVGKAFASTIRSGFGGGNRWDGRNVMTISSLKRKICPDGSCGDLFDGFNNTDVVNVSDFFSLLNGEFGFGGWSGWNATHYNHIKNRSDSWGMKSPTINLAGGIPTNANYKVGDFENGSPHISFSSFQSMAESIFSVIPYKFYYDSSWKGSWLGALQSGACNCVDGANALVAFASTCGFSGHTEHGTWVDPDGTTYPHVFAVINGKKMDTTGWQQRRSWSAGSPNVSGSNSRASNNKTVNVTVDMQGATIYGVDDLDSRIQESVSKGLQAEFNDPYTITI